MRRFFRGIGSPDKDSPTGPQTLRGQSTQAIILALVAVLVVPGILFAGLLLARFAESERSRYELEARDVARAAAAVLDRHLTGLQTTLQTLAVSQFLRLGDFEGFYRQAERVKLFIGADIGLRTLDGRQIINTRVPWGSALPTTPLAMDAQVIARGAPAVTDVFMGAVAKRPLVAIILPVTFDGDLKYLLHVSAETDRFYETIKPVVPQDWVVALGDRAGVFVARSENHAEFTGKPGVPAFLARASAHEGNFIGESAFGQPVLVGYTHSAITNWLVAASIRRSLIEKPLRDALWGLTAFGAAALFAAALIAVWLWRSVERPLAALARESRRIGAGETPARIRTSLRELAALDDALAAAAAQAQATNAQLEARVAERTRELERTNADLRAEMAAREKAEGELRQSQKMEAVGQLTGGIAHDFNNMLAIVIGSLSMLQRRFARAAPDDAALGKYADAAMEGANRAAELTRRLLAFSRQQALQPETVDANKLAAGMSELLRRTLGESIRVETVLAGGLWTTEIDPAQLESAIVNLAVNARDAMPDGGRLTIETANASLDDAYSALHSGVPAGQYVLVAVSDTGHGMSREIAARVLDPFFTTKPVGKGTGLGLSMVHGFVKQSGGHLKIYTEEGRGTTVKLYLPRRTGGQAAEPAPPRPAPRPGAGETILVVEDEERVRRFSVEALRELGYVVVEADGAAAALALLDTTPEAKLLFTDIVMPGLDGRKLADEAAQRRPDLKVLFTTGFTRNAVVHNGVLDAGVQLINKPFTIDELAAKIRAALDAPA